MDTTAVVKRALEAALVASGAPARRIRGGASDVVILSYHNVVPRGEAPVGDRSLHLSQARFAEHLDRLVESHDVVPLSTLDLGEGGEGRPRAVVTFDDAYRGAVTAGFEELARRGLPATVFVPPGLLGGEGFWWDRLAGAGGLAEAVRDHALDALGGRDEAVLSWAVAGGLPRADLPEHARPASAAELLAAASRGRFELGSHTWSHVNLAAVAPDEAEREIRRGHDWLDTVDGVPVVDWLAYPYGRFTPAAVDLAATVVGHAVRVEGGAARIRGEWVADRHRLPRINVPAGLSAHGLVIRLAGLR